ncbi:MAG: aminoacyl-tRNA hydrolase [Bacteroidia bacterium]|nr:MAG: aminoacyl-tRNA hydrolase [Bacteroidia bacterium]
MFDCLLGEVSFRTSRSSGPGGQHVNKTESRVELIWNFQETNCLEDWQKDLLAGRMGHRLTEDGTLILASEKYRSQHRNREDVTDRFLKLVIAGLVPVKKRRPTKPTRTSVEKRIKGKKIRGEIKKTRRLGPRE